MPAAKWVDLKVVKELVSIEDVLRHYGILDDLERKGDQLVGCCPLHQGQAAKKHFSANTARSIFQCFYCKCRGGVLEFVIAREGIESGRNAPREAGLLLMDWFADRFAGDTSTRRAEHAPAKDDPPQEVEQTADDSGDLFNKPLSFELQVDAEHEYLSGRGLTPETIQHFGLGFCSRGSMKGRIAIPIHNPHGELLAYAGRWVGDTPPEDEGKYKLPAGFHKSVEIYNLHRVPSDARQVIVVEGFFSVHWLHQNGWPNVVSLMGTTLSEKQVELLTTRFAGVRLLLDGDDPGRQATDELVTVLAKRTWVRASQCPDGLQPDRLPAHELAALLK